MRGSTNCTWNAIIMLQSPVTQLYLKKEMLVPYLHLTEKFYSRKLTKLIYELLLGEGSLSCHGSPQVVAVPV